MIQPTENRARLLLADDHRVLLECLEHLLASEFDVVGTASDGPTLLRRIGELRPDLVVSDISMPSMSGIDVMQKLAGDPDRPRFLFLTMHHDPQLAAEAIQQGARGFVLKESALTELLEAIRAVLSEGVWLSPRIAGEVLTAGLHAEPRSEDGELTARQLQVLDLLSKGLIAKEVAARLGISRKTVEYHKYKMMQVLGVRTTAELMHCAVRRGLILD